MLASVPPAENVFSYVLREDPDLAEGLPDEIRPAVTSLLRAPVLVLHSRRWSPPADEPTANTLGLLVLDGLLGQRVRIGNAVATELLMCGDILRPWDQPTLQNLIPAETDWRVFTPARLAILDQRATALIGRRPELTIALAGRLLRRARNAHYLLAVSHLSRVQDRLRALLWHIASTCGHVTPQGVKIPFRLTHEVVGEIIGAARPSVTLSFRELRDRGELIRTPDGEWVLTGDPAAAFAALGARRRSGDRGPTWTTPGRTFAAAGRPPRSPGHAEAAEPG